MSASLLLVAAEADWVGAARFPKAARDAGWEVALLAPRDSLIEKGRGIARVGHLPDQANPAQWLYALAATVTAVEPKVVVPCDDMSFRLLAALTGTRPDELQPAIHEKLRRLVEFSLGTPEHYAASVDKLRLPAQARALGVRVAESIVTEAPDDALAFTQTHGWPVVLKRSVSSGGLGVAICASAAELEAGFARLARPQPDTIPPFSHGVLVQRWLDGARVFHPAVAWRGRVVAGWCAEVLESNPAPKGPSCVRRQHHDPAVRDQVERLVAGLDMSGMISVDAIVERSTGLPHVLEINRRAAPSMHRGMALRVDLFAALLAAANDRPSPTRSALDPGEEHIDVAFPQEWLRDPHSEWLKRYPVDVPWDEPELFEACVGLWPGS
jgi:glutathione synthase/RimK-type ligase-like ATP-grasp enzyme